MKKILAVFLCVLIAFAGSILLSSCGKEKGTAIDPDAGGTDKADGQPVFTGVYSESKTEKTEEIANPVEEYGTDEKSLENAQKAVGFNISVPKSIKAENYVAISGNILEINFADGYIRKAKGGEDMSGDYNDYEKTELKTLNGKKITLKGNSGKVILAIWSDGDYTYSIRYNSGKSEADMLSIVNEIK